MKLKSKNLKRKILIGSAQKLRLNKNKIDKIY